MLTNEERERLRKMSEEERKRELLDSTSDAVRHEARHLAMLKAISYRENGIEPEEFDAALERELRKAWDRVKDKSSVELAIMGLFEMASNGADIGELIGGVK